MTKFEKYREQWIDFAAENFNVICFIAGFTFTTIVFYVVCYLRAVN